MKKAVSIILILLISFAGWAQDTVHVYTGAGAPMPSRSYKFRSAEFDSSTWFRNVARFDDSASFGKKVYLPMAPTADSSNEAASTKWVKQNVSPGVPGQPTTAWQYLGNYSPSLPSPGRLGQRDSFPVMIITNDLVRLIVPDNGIKRSSGAANKVLMYDTAAHKLYYTDMGGGGGGTGTVTSVAALTIGTTGIDLTSSVANPTTTPVITLNVPTASAINRGALSSTDWSTFNSKGIGTLTNFTAGTLSPLFTTSVATSTTTPALTFSLTNAAGGTIFGNNGSSSGAPAYTAVPVLGIAGTTLGTLGLAGNTSGIITIKPQAAAGTYNWNLPTTAGTSGYLLTSAGGGSSPMTWTNPASYLTNIYNSDGQLTGARVVDMNNNDLAFLRSVSDGRGLTLYGSGLGGGTLYNTNTYGIEVGVIGDSFRIQTPQVLTAAAFDTTIYKPLAASSSGGGVVRLNKWDFGWLPVGGRAYTTTTGNGISLTSSTLTTGTLMNLTLTGTAAASNTKKAFSIISSGANGTATQTVTGQTISVTNTGTTSTNVGLNVTASGATNNYAALFTGNVGIGTTTPAVPLDVTGNTNVTGNLTTLATNYAGESRFEQIDADATIRVVGKATNGDSAQLRVSSEDVEAGLFTYSHDQNIKGRIFSNPSTGVVFEALDTSNNEYGTIIIEPTKTLIRAGTTSTQYVEIDSPNGIRLSNGIPVYADNAAAITGGLSVGDLYRTGDLLKIVH